MNETLQLLGLLAIAVFANVLGGVYYNVNIKKMSFDWFVLINGVIKAVIVGVMFLGVACIFESIPALADAIGVTPKFIMISAITLYTGKALVSLGKILGIEVTTK